MQQLELYGLHHHLQAGWHFFPELEEAFILDRLLALSTADYLAGGSLLPKAGQYIRLPGW